MTLLKSLHIDYGWLGTASAELSHFDTLYDPQNQVLLFEGLWKSLPNSDLKQKRITQELWTLLGWAIFTRSCTNISSFTEDNAGEKTHQKNKNKNKKKTPQSPIVKLNV